MELPEVGQLKSLFDTDFTMELYKERNVGPLDARKVTVKMFARLS